MYAYIEFAHRADGVLKKYINTHPIFIFYSGSRQLVFSQAHLAIRRLSTGIKPADFHATRFCCYILKMNDVIINLI